MAETLKQKASTSMSRYIRLRDALEYCNKHSIDISQFARPEMIIGQCCTCPKVGSWLYMDAGHFESRGLGGSSGVYFDERNVHLQCKRCNGPGSGMRDEYEQFIITKYGVDVLEEIKKKHKLPTSFRDLAMIATEKYYKDKYEELLQII